MKHPPRSRFFAALAIFCAASSANAKELLTNNGQIYSMGTYSAPEVLESDDHHLYLIDTARMEAEPEFDIEVVMEVLQGDADLKVIGPVKTSDGQEASPVVRKKSIHHTGTDTVFLSREELAENSGIYQISVDGWGDANDYRLTFEKSYITRVPSSEEQEALEALYKSCCSWPGSCSLLGEAVASSKAEGEDPAAFQNFCHLEDQACDKDGHITALRLPAESMECQIVPELANLKKLQRLDLEDNYIFGSLDEAYDILKDLSIHSIHLGRNEIHGGLACIPEGTSLYESLTYLDLKFNFIEGEIQSCAFGAPSLEIMDVEGNTLYGEFPKELPEAPSLRRLDLSWQGNGDTHLTGSLPDMRKWSRLEALNVQDNRLSGAFPLLPKSMKALFLDENEFDGALPSDLGTYFENMEILELKENAFTGALPESLPPRLEYFNVDQNSLEGPIPFSQWFAGEKPPLQELRMGGNQLSGNVSALLGQIPTLWAINITQNRLSGGLAAFVEALPMDNKILQFEVGFNALTGSLPKEISNLRMLHGVEQDYPHRPDKSPAFDVASNQLTGRYPIELSLDASDEWHNMFFDVSGNQFTCPEEYLGLDMSKREVRLLLNDEKCLDRRGFLVSIGADQLKKQNVHTQPASSDIMRKWSP